MQAGAHDAVEEAPRHRYRPGRDVMATLLRLIPRRPEPTDPRARRVVEWAEVIYYVFVLAIVPSMPLTTAALLLFWPTTPGSKRPPLAVDASGVTTGLVRLSTEPDPTRCAACRYLHVYFMNFDGAKHTIVCRASNGDEG